MLVQQLVLAAAAAVGKERLRYCNVGLSQRCGGEFFTRSYAATGVQLRCKLGVRSALFGLLSCKPEKNHHPSRDVVPRRIEASQKEKHQRSSACHQNSAPLALPSRNCLRPGRSHSGPGERQRLTRAIARCPTTAYATPVKGSPTSYNEPHLRRRRRGPESLGRAGRRAETGVVRRLWH